MARNNTKKEERRGTVFGHFSKKNKLRSPRRAKIKAYHSVTAGVTHIVGSTFPPEEISTRTRGVHEASHHMLMKNVIGGTLVLFDSITTRIFLEMVRKLRDTNSRLPPLSELLSDQSACSTNRSFLLLSKFENIMDWLTDNWRLTQEGFATFRALRLYSKKSLSLRDKSEVIAKAYNIAEKIERTFGPVYVSLAAEFASQVPLYEIDFLETDEKGLKDQLYREIKYSPDLRFQAISRIRRGNVPSFFRSANSVSPQVFFGFLSDHFGWKMADNKTFVDWSLRFIQQLPFSEEILKKIDHDFRMNMRIHFGDPAKIVNFLKQRPKAAAAVLSNVTGSEITEELAIERLEDEETAKKAALYYLSIYPPLWIYEYEKPVRTKNEYESAYIATRPDISEDRNLVEWILSKEVIERIKTAYLKGEKRRVAISCFGGLFAKCKEPEYCLPHEISDRLSGIHLWIKCSRKSYLPNVQKT
jgi:hypothetical protein